MHPTNCLNCGTILTADDNFCPTCGQKTDTHRITLSHIFHEFFHSFTHADKGLLGIIADLATRPGIVAWEYINGKRKKYFNPFTFFVLCLSIFIIANNTFKTYQQVEPDPRVQQLPPKQRNAVLALYHRLNEAQHFMQSHSNIVSMIGLPFFALMSWLFFMRRGFNYGELLVANMMFLGFGTLLFTLLVSTWLGRFVGQPLYYYGLGFGFLIQFVYIGWAQYQLFDFKKKYSIILTIAVTMLTNVLWVCILIVLMVYYVFRSDAGKTLKAMWKEVF